MDCPRSAIIVFHFCFESLAKFHIKRHTRTRWGAASRFSLRSKVPFEASVGRSLRSGYFDLRSQSLRCYDSRTLCGLACAPRTSLTPGCPVESRICRPQAALRSKGASAVPLLMLRPGMVLSISHPSLSANNPIRTISPCNNTRIVAFLSG